MRIGNQAALQELAERINQADAVVIGGGSGLSSAAGYDHYHWSPALRRHWLPFANSMTSPPRWLDSTIAFPTMGNSGGITANICASCGKPYRAALFGPTGACCG